MAFYRQISLLSPWATCTKSSSLTGKEQSAMSNHTARRQTNPSLIYQVHENAPKGWAGIAKRLTVAALASNGLSDIGSQIRKELLTPRSISAGAGSHRCSCGISAASCTSQCKQKQATLFAYIQLESLLISPAEPTVFTGKNSKFFQQRQSFDNSTCE